MKSNILTQEEIKIIELFRNNLQAEYTIREIMNQLKKNSYNWIFNSIKKLSQLNLVNIKIQGKAKICSLNLNNNLTLTYFALLEQQQITKKLPLENITKLINLIPLSYFTFLITGSYAQNKQTKTSDLDVVVITENKKDAEKILPILKNEGELMHPEVHAYTFSKDEFLKMLLNKEQNYGKEIYKNKIIFFGAENYYKIIKEAIENGFKD